ncbi:MAG: M55 family metallopeptidase [Eubacteriaceae bacterium]|nr:M55 family metallopeptidase [Eubacteriaceae bacterium]
MKIYISVDIEGISSIAHWDETEASPGGSAYSAFAEQMTQEANAAIIGALEAGASEVLVQDAHNTARNIIPSLLEKEAKLMRGWPGSIFSMVDFVEGFDGVAYIGYHSPGGSNSSPLAHTMTTKALEVKINGIRASEFSINCLSAARRGAASIFLSGDEGICNEAAAFAPGLIAVATKTGKGNSIVGIHPQKAIDLIQSGMKEAVESLKAEKIKPIAMPSAFEVEIMYKDHDRAYYNSSYPGAKLVDERTINFKAVDCLDVMAFFHFVL